MAYFQDNPGKMVVPDQTCIFTHCYSCHHPSFQLLFDFSISYDPVHQMLKQSDLYALKLKSDSVIAFQAFLGLPLGLTKSSFLKLLRAHCTSLTKWLTF